jgi:hypothetical protein
MAMDEKFWPSRKVCNYTFNFMAMSCLLWLTILWHMFKATRLFLVTCVHYNYKWIANLVVDFQFSFSEGIVYFFVKRIYNTMANIGKIRCSNYLQIELNWMMTLKHSKLWRFKMQILKNIKGITKSFDCMHSWDLKIW